MRQLARVLTRPSARAALLVGAAALVALTYVVSASAAPTNSALPTVSGQFVDGGTLSADPGVWTAGPDVTYSYQWLQCGSYRDAVTATTPAGYWRLDDQPNPNGAPATAVDSSGHGNDGTFGGSPPMGYSGALAGDPDTAVQFASSAPSVSLPGSYPTGRSVVTLEAWYKPANTNALRALVGYGDTTVGNQDQFVLAVSGTTPQIRYGTQVFSGTTALAAGTWYHLAAVDTGSALQLYVNGVLQPNSVTPGTGFQKANGQAQIGRFTPGDTNNTTNASGVIDEVAIYAAALTQPQIQSHYGAGGVNGTSCGNLNGATSQLYYPQPSNVGHRVEVQVTALDSTGSAQAFSPATLIAGGGPVSVLPPTISGTPEQGQTLTATEGSWSGLTFTAQPTYQWQRCGYQAAVLGDHPLSYYRLGEPAGTVAADGGSLNAPGTYVSFPTLGVVGALNGDANTAATFDGSSQYVTLPGTYPTGRAPASIEAWVKPTATTPLTLGSYGDGVTNYRSFTLQVGGSPLKGTIDIKGSAYTGAIAMNVGQWSHLVAVDDGTNIKLYVNGQLDTSWVPSVQFNKANGMAVIGVRPYGMTQYLAGSLDEFAIYGTALTANQVATHYQAGVQEAAGFGCQDIATPGASGSFDPVTQQTTYTVTAADNGYKLRVKVVAQNVDGATEADSDSVNVSSSAPAAASLPAISGSTAQGSTLTADPGTWRGTQPILYAYQWNTCGYQDAVLGDQPIGYWRLGDDPNQLLVADSTGHGFNGTLTNASAQGVLGAQGALLGDGDAAALFGTTSAMEVPDGPQSNLTTGQPTLDPPGGYSVELWLRPTTATLPTNDTIIDKMNNGGWKLRYSYPNSTRTGKLEWSVGASTSGSTITGTTVINDPTRWYHIVATAGGPKGGPQTTNLYVDGALVASGTYSGNLTHDPAASLGIGDSGSSTSFYIDDVSYYGSALTTAQVSAHYAARACQPIAGETNATHLVASADAGKRLSVTATATNVIGSRSASSLTKTVTGNALPENTARPNVSGDWSVGSTVQADAGAWNSPTTLSYAYQWQRCAYSTAVLGDHPAAYWPLGEIGGPTVNDVSGNGSNGTATAVNFGVPGGLADSADTAVRIGGTGSGIVVPNASTLNVGSTGTFSLEAWVGTNNVTASGQYIFNKGWYSTRILDSGGNQVGTAYHGDYVLEIQKGGLIALGRSDWTGATPLAVSTTPFPTDGRLHHIVVTAGGTPRYHIYLDGQPLAITTPNGVAFEDSQEPLNIGEGATYNDVNYGGRTGSNSFTGDLSELAVYPTTLSSAQVQAHYQAAQAVCSNISGATSQSYTVTSTDLNQDVRVKVTATNTAGSASAASLGGYVTSTASVGRLEPANGSMVQTKTPLLYRDQLPGTNDYQFEVSNNQSFGVVNGQSLWVRTSAWQTQGNSFTVPSNWSLKDATDYWWHVRTRTGSVVGAWTPATKFTVQLGLNGSRDYWPMWKSGPLAVNLATGNLVFTPLTPSYPTATGSMAMTLTYNSLDKGTTGSRPANQWLMSGGDAFGTPPTLAPAGETVYVTWPDGSSDAFNHIANSSQYTPPPGETSHLVSDGQSPAGSFSLTDAGGSVYDYSVDATTGDVKLTKSEVVDAQPGKAPMTYTFDGSKRLTKITDDAGRTLTFTWPVSGCAPCTLQATGPDGVTWKYINDQGGLLTRINDGTRDIYKFTYDANKRLQKIQNADDLNPSLASPGYNGTHSIQMVYDASGRVTSISEGPITGQTPSTSTTSFDYHPDTTGAGIQTDPTRATHLIPSDGYPWEQGYNKNGTTLAAGAPRTADGYTLVTPPNLQGQQPLRGTKTYYDAYDHPIETVDVLGHITEQGYNARDQLLWSEDADGNPTDYTYDPVTDQQLTVTGPDPDGTGPLSRPVTRTFYDELTPGNGTRAGTILHGLQGAYYANSGLQGRPTAQRTDATVDFDWGAGGPAILPGTTSNYSIRWTGLLDVSQTGSYTFFTYADKGTRLTIDNLQILDAWKTQNGITVASQPIKLTAGRHRISMDYYVTSGTAQVQLKWRCSGCPTPIAAQVIPTSALLPSWNNATSSVTPSGHVSFSHFAAAWLHHPDYTFNVVGAQNIITSYGYDSYGRTLSKVMPKGNAGRTIDANGNLSGAADGKYTTTYSYYGVGETATPSAACGGGALNQAEALKMTSQYGLAAVTNVYDAAGNARSMTGGKGTECSTYDAEGRLASKKDGNGVVTTTTYDPMGNVLSTTIAGGGTTATAYDEMGQPVAQTDSDGHTTTYVHDLQGNVIKTTDPTGAVTTATFDAVGNQLSSTDPLGRTMTYTYDSSNHRTSVATPLGRTTTTKYDALGRVIEVDDPRGGRTLNAYDADGNPTNTTDALGNTTAFTYDALARKTSTTDAKGHTTSYTYDLNGNKASETEPDGSVRNFTYTPYDKLATETDGLGHVTSYTYDGDGRQTSKTLPTGETTKTTYDWEGNQRTSTDAVGNVTTNVYGPQNRLIKQTSPLAEVTQTAYDPVGNVLTRTDARGKVTSYTYDAANRVTSMTDPLGAVTSSTYDAAGQLTSQTNGNGKTTSFTYDADGNRTKVTAPDGGVTTFVFDANGNATSRTDPLGHTSSKTYDALNQISTSTDSLGRTTTFTYDAVGNQTKLVDANGGTTTSQYDSMDRVSAVSYSDATPGVSYTYDAAGNKLTMTDGAGTKTYGYDASNRVTSATRGGQAFTYTYNSAGLLASRTYPNGGTTSYTYDADGRMKTVTRGSNATTYSYDAAGDRTAIAYPNGWTERVIFDDAGRISDMRSTNSSGTVAVTTYTRDGDGNPTQIVRDSVTENYSYDSLDRLTAVCYGAAISSCPSGSLITYSYDAVGNRLTQNRFGLAKSYTYDAADELTQTVDGGGTTAFAYDADGNEVQAGNRTFSYNVAAQLTSVKDSGTTTASYTYDGNGNRLTQTAAGQTTTCAWDENGDLPQLALEKNGSTVLRDYIYGTDDAAVVSGGDTHYYHHDALGSTGALTSSSGTVESQTTYDPFGTIRSETSNGPSNSLKFTGAMLDAATGLYNLRARTYDPASGRFLSVDPLQQDPSQPYRSTYLYANDRPSMLTDPSGKSVADEDPQAALPQVESRPEIDMAQSTMEVAGDESAASIEQATAGELEGLSPEQIQQVLDQASTCSQLDPNDPGCKRAQSIAQAIAHRPHVKRKPVKKKNGPPIKWTKNSVIVTGPGWAISFPRHGTAAQQATLKNLLQAMGTLTKATDKRHGGISDQELAVRLRIVAVSLYADTKRTIRYSQGSDRMSGIAGNVKPPNLPPAGDCSAFATWIYKVAGAPRDPNKGGTWSATETAYTGSLWDGGHATNPKAGPLPGDLVFFGEPHKGGRGPAHVAVYIGNGQQVGHGSGYGPRLGTVSGTASYNGRGTWGYRSYFP